MLHWLLEPWQYDFMVKALAISVLIGLVCGVLSCFVTLQGWALLGDAVSHAVTPGVVLAYALGWPLALGALLFGLAAVLLMGWIQRQTRLKEDTTIGLVFTGFFALGLVLISKTPGHVDFLHILFGNLLGMPAQEMWQTLVMGVLVLGVVWVWKNDLLLLCFDPVHARSIGIDIDRLYYVLLTLLSLTIVVAMQAVGVVLVVAMLITPGATAYLLSDRFNVMLVWAMATGVTASVVGTYASYYLDASTGGCIVLAQTLLFFLALVFAPKYGLGRRV
ncbi:MAG: metal ABC transporter permease [Gloeomargarita sp. SKYBB_i_bin120]|nr:metal ABC transporter permease [Gloeomargarita sp. SKYG98]MCS7292036.1 metal ABC transporter permease [Gloeomargarita sp. SKYB120]MDW8177596.1 metal ABC transporter permease [Gloeomargarita sp. SKYBB_i_bin120]